MTHTTQTETRKSISQPRIFVHLNGLGFLVGAVVAYGAVSGDWLAFILLLLVPDVAMIGYKVNRTIGSWMYNIMHSYILAVGIIILGYTLGINVVVSLGLILLAHIGMDQMMGFGYKYADAEFSDTHISRL